MSIDCGSFVLLQDVNRFCQVEAEHQTEQLKHGLLEGCQVCPSDLLEKFFL